MSSGYFPRGPALVAAAPDADPVTRLVLGWLAGKPSASTRAAYARDIGLISQQRPSRAPSWLAWCREQSVHPVTGVTGLVTVAIVIQLEKIDVDQDQRQRFLGARRALHFTQHVTVEVTPVGDSGKPVLARNTLELAIGDGQLAGDVEQFAAQLRGVTGEGFRGCRRRRGCIRGLHRSPCTRGKDVRDARGCDEHRGVGTFACGNDPAG